MLASGIDMQQVIFNQWHLNAWHVLSIIYIEEQIVSYVSLLAIKVVLLALKSLLYIWSMFS